ncbi:hypothetical protein ACFSJS_27340 [Streptomyces desertarenae]|uniref:Uncharacterized protein n=1 Tax=Streptomyces desertarenae TaxID=2666184 RepID=A0ABW4PT48_9ACTN
MTVLAVLGALLAGAPAASHAAPAAVFRAAEPVRAAGTPWTEADALAPARTSGGSGASGVSGGRAGSMSSAGGIGVASGMGGVSGMSGAAGAVSAGGTVSTGGTGGARGSSGGTWTGLAAGAAIVLLFMAGPALVHLLAVPFHRYARRGGRRGR